MRSTLASARGLFAGWLLAATVRALAGSARIGAAAAAGAHDRALIGIALAELLGAALFAFEPAVVAGFVLIMASLAAAAAKHVYMRQMPWHLGCYALAAALLLYFTHRARRANGHCRAAFLPGS